MTIWGYEKVIANRNHPAPAKVQKKELHEWNKLVEAPRPNQAKEPQAQVAWESRLNYLW